jgi:transmembrane sensor
MEPDALKSDRVEDAAIRWFVRQQSDAWTDADQAELDAWLAAETAHRIQYIRASTAWSESARLKALGAGVPAGVVPPRGAWGDMRYSRGKAAADTRSAEIPSAATKPWRRAGRVALAASVLIALAVGFYSLDATRFSGAQFSTPVGGIENVPLADGSKITLNTDTRIRVVFTAKERRIRLEQGEAFFEVAKDPQRPFIVYAGDRRVIAVGTKFSVRRDEEDIQVVVTEGRVNLAAADMPAVANGGDTPEAPTLLDAGAIARTASSGLIVRPGAATEAEKLLSWRRGYVSFDNMPLAEAVAEFNRYNTRKIYIEDPAIAAIRVGGNFRSDNTDAFLDLLERGFPIAVQQENDTVILRSR